MRAVRTFSHKDLVEAVGRSDSECATRSVGRHRRLTSQERPLKDELQSAFANELTVSH